MHIDYLSGAFDIILVSSVDVLLIWPLQKMTYAGAPARA
jgi:hypothetical protein